MGTVGPAFLRDVLLQIENLVASPPSVAELITPPLLSGLGTPSVCLSESRVHDSLHTVGDDRTDDGDHGVTVTGVTGSQDK